MKIINRSLLRSIVLTPLNFSVIQRDERQKGGLFNKFSLLLHAFTIVLISLFLYKVLSSKSVLGKNFTDFLWVFLGVFLFVIIKKSIDYALIYLLRIKNILGDFLVDKSKSFYANTFLFYILLILTEFTQLSENHLLWVTALFFLYRFVFIVVKNKKLIFNKLFYFILYICTLEIAPLLIIYKFVLKA